MRILGGVFVAVMGAGLAVTITAQAPTNNTIYACVNPSGLVRIIPPRAACLGSEQPIQWNVTGPMIGANATGKELMVATQEKPIPGKQVESFVWWPVRLIIKFEIDGGQRQLLGGVHKG